MPYQPTHVDNIVLGAGYLYFDKFDDDGNKTGERYLGQTPGFTFSMSSEKLEKYTSDGPIAELMVSVTTQISREGTITCDDISAENLALFIAGDVDTAGQSADTALSQTFTATPGREYQLGDGAGYTNIDSVVVTTVSGSTALTLGDDYEVDAEGGRVIILEGGAISAPEEVEVTFDIDADADAVVISTTDQVSLRGAIRFRGDNTVGENRDVYIPNAELSPDGEFQFKSRDDFQQITFSFSAQKPKDGGKAVYIRG